MKKAVILAACCIIAPTIQGFLLRHHQAPCNRRRHRDCNKNLVSITSTSTPDSVDNDDETVIASVKAWVESMVIGLELCPFAEKVVRANTVSYVVSHAKEVEGVITDVISEALRLITTPESTISTTVVITPDCFKDDFEAFYDTELFLEDHLLEDSNLGEEVLPASFHPQYLFGGLDEDDPVHYEKRSPYPVFNLLRARRVEQYASEGLTQKIGEKNEKKLTSTGIEEVRRRFDLALKAKGDS